jgi:FkbM family methyltransferase
VLHLSLPAKRTSLSTTPSGLLADAVDTVFPQLGRSKRRMWPLKAHKVGIADGTARIFHCRADTSDYASVRQIFGEKHYCLKNLNRAQEIDEFIARRSAAGERPLIIDAGANIGASAVYFAMTYPGAKVVAIEPEAGNFQLLCKNAVGLDIHCLEAGLSSADGRIRVTNPDATKWGFQTEPTEDGTGIPCVTVQEIYARECGHRKAFPFIFKIDIEGAEADVFARNIDWVARTPIVMIELHDWLFPKAGTSAGFFRCIAGQPRDIILVGENVFAIAHSLE